MTPRVESSIERTVGRIEAQNEALAENFKALTDAVLSIKEAAEPMRADIAELKRRADISAAVTDKFNALEQSFHDGKIAGKAFILGLSVAAGAGGAVVVTAAKGLWALIFGA